MKSYDPVLNLLYWGVGNPGPDYNGESRGGDNLYTNVVALDADDAMQMPLLVDTTFRGERRRLLLWANRFPRRQAGLSRGDRRHQLVVAVL